MVDFTSLRDSGVTIRMGRYVDLELVIEPPLSEEDVGCLHVAFCSADYDFPGENLPKGLGGYWRKPSISLFEILDFIALYVNDGRSIRGITRSTDHEDACGDRQGDRLTPYCYDHTWYSSAPWDTTKPILGNTRAQWMVRGMVTTEVYDRAGVLTKEMGDRFSRLVLTIFGPETHQKYLTLATNHGEWWELAEGDTIRDCLTTEP